MVKANEPPREWISWGQSTRVLPSLKRIGSFRVHIIQYRWTVSYTFSSCARLQLTKFISSKSGLSFSEFGHSHGELKTCGMIRTFCGNPTDFVAPNFETHYLASMAFGDGTKTQVLWHLRVAKQLQALAWLLEYQRKQAEEFLGGHQVGMRKHWKQKHWSMNWRNS